MIASETLVVVALIAQVFLPTDFGVTFPLPHRMIGIPTQWFLPLLLISVAGVFSTAIPVKRLRAGLVLGK